MSKRIKTTFILILFIILFSSFVSAGPKPNEVFIGNNGLVIEVPIFNYYPLGENLAASVHVFNYSNGKILTNYSSSPVQCSSIMTAYNGSEIIELMATPHNNHFDFAFNSSYTQMPGLYGFTIFCNNSYLGGYKTGYFELTSIPFREVELDGSLLFVSILLPFLMSLILGGLSVGLYVMRAKDTPEIHIFLRVALMFLGIYELLIALGGIYAAQKFIDYSLLTYINLISVILIAVILLLVGLIRMFEHAFDFKGKNERSSIWRKGRE